LSKQPVRRIGLKFDDQDLVPLLFGEHDSHLAQIEEGLDVEIAARGNEIIITATKPRLRAAQAVFDVLWGRLQRGMEVTAEEVMAAIEVAKSPMDENSRTLAMTALQDTHVALKSKNKSKNITARNPKQAEYLDAINKNHLVFGLGPAGTGKTFLAVAQAVQMMLAGTLDRLILCRPAVEAGEKLGFLPGDLSQKVDPYLRPLYDALYDLMGFDKVGRLFEKGTIEVAPLAYMRGRTLNQSFVILDEAQNTTPEQMKMFLTRIGFGSRAVITGDVTQIDLGPRQRSGLVDARQVLSKVRGIAFCNFTAEDVVRHPLVARIVEAYDRHDTRRGPPE
jgi:phosphate starvation-inducible PhoH-like protein